jgi:hypothetical protein
VVSFRNTPLTLNHNCIRRVTKDTLYRIASVSKVYTGLALLRLQDKIDMQASVTNYLPELKELVKDTVVGQYPHESRLGPDHSGVLDEPPGGIGSAICATQENE